MSPSSRRQPRQVLAWKFKGVDAAGAEKMGLLLLIPLQASAGKSTAK